MRQIPRLWRTQALGIGEVSKVEQLARKTDFDNGTPIDVRLNELSPANRLSIRFVVANVGSDPTQISLQANAVADASYSAVLDDGVGDRERQDDRESWPVVTVPKGVQATGDVTMTGGNMPPETPFHVDASIEAPPGWTRLSGGTLNVSAGTVDELRFRTGGMAIGKVVIFGELL